VFLVIGDLDWFCQRNACYQHAQEKEPDMKSF